MSVSKAARTRAASAASKARADVAKATSDLSSKSALLAAVKVADKIVDVIPSVVTSRVPFVKDFTSAQVAVRQAEVDEATADKAAAEARLNLAESTKRAVDNTIDESVELKGRVAAAAKKAQEKAKDLAD